jgi:uncharacterized repeat protein (TIGR02543 family)
MPSGGITLYAKWEPNLYTITFETNGGSAIDSIELGYETDIPSVDNPTKVGYTFAGWFSDQGLTQSYIIDTMPLNGITLYAKWEPALVNVDIHIYLESLTEDVYDLDETLNTTALTQSTYTHMPTAVSGFTFNTEHLLNDLEVVVLADGSSSVSVYYMRDTIAITYETNGGSAVNLTEGLFEEVYVNPFEPQKLGYAFVDWYLDEALTTVSNITVYPAEDITLYAKWEPANSSIIFDTKGGLDLDDLVALTDSDITIPTKTKEGYDFLGWYLEATYDNSFTQTKMPAGTTTVYAKWELKEYSITYDSAGGSTSHWSKNFD